MPSTVSRRSFLKASLFGALALASAGGAYRLLAPSEPPPRFALDDKTHQVLAAIVPIVLQGAISADQVGEAIERVGQAIANLPLSTQQEVQDLFALLILAPTRRFVAGLKVDWSRASAEDVAAFLQDWRLSRFALLQSAYHALHDLITGSWYADESTWAGIGYPGPMKELT